MKKLILLGSLLGIISQQAAGADNTIEMHQDGPENQAEITQQGSGNRVIINQGTATPHKDGCGEKVNFNPRKHRTQHWQRTKQGKSQNLQIHQQGGGKLKVDSRSGNGRIKTDIKSEE